MNGNRIVLDTNAIIALLQSNQRVIDYAQSAKWVGISVISQIEFLSFSKLADADRELFGEFVARVEVIDIRSTDQSFLDLIVKIRQETKPRLPDAIIAATAVHHDASVVTADTVLAKMTRLEILPFEQ
ncbi:MAG TPA: PIN domain-containing protein [Tepidisphaeraceae bacterium]|nr:PIN domain-containing protein [Tepidisphaeraceae bacterium]